MLVTVILSPLRVLSSIIRLEKATDAYVKRLVFSSCAHLVPMEPENEVRELHALQADSSALLRL